MPVEGMKLFLLYSVMLFTLDSGFREGNLKKWTVKNWPVGARNKA